MKDKAVKYAGTVGAELARMQRELREREAVISAQELQIEELQALLLEHGIMPIAGRG